MQYTIAQLSPFTIAGIAVRTTNADGQAQKDIGMLWQTFMQKQVLQSIPNRVSDEVYSLYTGYEGDFKAPYTTIIGCKVSATDGLPDGLIYKAVPANNYQVYKPVGELPGSIMQTWVYIWQSNIHRAYTADFDLYKTDGSVETYLSVIE